MTRHRKAGRVRRVAAVMLSVAAMASGVAGCAQTPSATVSITYDDNGTQRSITAHPSSLTCETDKVTADGVRDDPASLVLMHRSSSTFGASASALIITNDVMVQGKARPSDNPTIMEDGSHITTTFSGDVVVLAKKDDPAGFASKSLDSDATSTTTGTVSIEVACP